MPITFDFTNSDIVVTSPDTSLLVQDLVNAIRSAESSSVGITYAQIANASGKEQLASGVQVGITCQLLGTWGIKWWVGNYQASISGGNLVSVTGNPLKYVVGGPQVIVTESAAATIVSTSGGPLTTAQNNKLMGLPSAADTSAAVGAAEIATGWSRDRALRKITAMTASKTSGNSAGGGTVVIRTLDDTGVELSATVDSDGNRTSVTQGS